MEKKDIGVDFEDFVERTYVRIASTAKCISDAVDKENTMSWN